MLPASLCARPALGHLSTSSTSSELRVLLALRISAAQVPATPGRVTIAGTGQQRPLRWLAQQAPADLLGQPRPLLLTLLGQLGLQLRKAGGQGSQPARPGPPAFPTAPSPQPHLGLFFHQLLQDLLLPRHQALLPLLLGLLQLWAVGGEGSAWVARAQHGWPGLRGQQDTGSWHDPVQATSRIMGTPAGSLRSNRCSRELRGSAEKVLRVL